MSVKFIDNSIKVKSALNDACIAYLYEATHELASQTKDNMPTGSWNSEIKNEWQVKVDVNKLEGVVGNPLESSLWVEFGTGEHAINHDGHKGYWVYVPGDSTHSAAYNGKSYTLEEAKRTVAWLKERGVEARYTKGQRAKRPFFKAYKYLKPSLIKRAETVLKGRFK